MARGKTNVEVRISHGGDRLYDFYEQTLADLRARHMHPEQTFLGKYGELTAEEAAKISCRDAEGRAAANRRGGPRWVQDSRQTGHWEDADGGPCGRKVY
jgi:hypothetical protein